MPYSGSIIEYKAVICSIQVVLWNIRLSYSGSVMEYKAVLCPIQVVLWNIRMSYALFR